MTLPLSGKTALVTGASRGIGAAVAKRLARDGAKLILHYSAGAAEVKEVAREIEREGHGVSTVQADLGSLAGPKELAKQLEVAKIDILVNNAGVAPFAAFDQMDEASFDQMANLNMRSVFFLTQALLPKIPDGGRIINLSSLVTRAFFPGIPGYSASKGFVDVLTLHLAADLGKRNITVNAIAPGAIDTRMSAWIHGPGGKETLAQMQALPGIGQPEHIASVAAFLAGPDGAWTTGQIIDASGGTKL
jgi:3-oxoacyl-[acyl-carrier protein] reductase